MGKDNLSFVNLVIVGGLFATLVCLILNMLG